ncbi:hypothetical protein [uncultured Ruegeria sp.]|uniref:hypothetical protein n=1 Tax=uncultured Ruegeria sp. TaxID=259304 RepID=UPI00260451F5|nr:hypothetical protein [uncultured Ruegeria sp.]
MILETLRLFFLFVVAVSILPLSILAARNYARGKRAIVDGMAGVDEDTLDRLGWEPRDYVGWLDLLFLSGSTWSSRGLAMQQQNAGLQRILLKGLPRPVEFSDEVRRSARRFRFYFCLVVAPMTAFFMLPAYIRLSLDLSSFSGLPLSLCYILFGLANVFIILTPLEKFRKWPDIEAPS